MEPVVTLGLSVLARTTELVVIRGDVAQGIVIDRVVTETPERPSANRSRLQQAVDNVLQTQALAIAHGYRVHAVGVVSEDSPALIAALKDAGLQNVSTLDPVSAREIFTQPENTAIDDATSIRARRRRRWIFVAAMVVAVAALTFAIVDRWQATPRPTPQQPLVTPAPPTSTQIVETPPPPPPPGSTQEAPPPPATPEYAPPPRRSPVQQAPPHRPSPPPAPPPPPAEWPAPEPAPTDDCMFLCGVTL